MSSFPKELSSHIDHGRAAFYIHNAIDDGKTFLCQQGRWLLNHAYRNTPSGQMPSRDDINPTDMKSLLPNVTILQPVLDCTGQLKDIIVRLMGSKVSNFYGQLSGHSLNQLEDKVAYDRGLKCVQRVLETTTPVVGVSKRTDFDVPYHQVTMLFIPLRDRHDKVPQILSHFRVERSA